METQIKSSLFLMCLMLGLIGMSFNACNSESQKEAELSEAVDLKTQSDIRGDEDDKVFKIGVIKEGKFSFIVSEDELAAVYNYNIEKNLGASGTMTEARVDFPEEGAEDPTAYVVLNGNYGEKESSASLSADVSIENGDPEGLLKFVVVNYRPVRAGLCYRTGCPSCDQQPISAGNRNCRCFFGPDCPYYPDPHIIWVW